MDLNNETLRNIEENAKGIVDKHVFEYVFNKAWKDVVVSLINEIRQLRNKYESK